MSLFRSPLAKLQTAVFTADDFLVHKIRLLEWVGQMCAIVALTVLGVRAMLTWDTDWDNLVYHLPFAAQRAGVNISYHLTGVYLKMYQGFPPLADWVQGALWRITGSVNAANFVNFLFFCVFLAFCHFCLRASAWLITLIALTVPLIIIHLTVGYIDLTANLMVAAGGGALFKLILVPDTFCRRAVYGGLVGVVGAAWAKFTVVPIAVIIFIGIFVAVWRQRDLLQWSKKTIILIFTISFVVFSLPYLKNITVYGNPFWPYRFLTTFNLPYVMDPTDAIRDNRPPNLQDEPAYLIYLRSLFEIGHPTSYPDRARWTVDQGNSYLAFRSGGWWNVGLVTYVLLTLGSIMFFAPVVSRRRKTLAAVGFLSLFVLVGFMSQAHELRYYLFLPLCWALIVALLYPYIKTRAPTLAAVILLTILGLFGYMVEENAEHYTIAPSDYNLVTHSLNLEKLWATMSPGKAYCSVGMDPIPLLFTGPTMKEYNIVSVEKPELCPDGMTVLTKVDVLSATTPGFSELIRRHR